MLSTRRQAIATAFGHAWSGYSTHCLGHDALHPVTDTCSDDFGGWGVTAIDALSTAILLEKEAVVLEILHFIARPDTDECQYTPWPMEWGRETDGCSIPKGILCGFSIALIEGFIQS